MSGEERVKYPLRWEKVATQETKETMKSSPHVLPLPFWSMIRSGFGEPDGTPPPGKPPSPQVITL